MSLWIHPAGLPDQVKQDLRKILPDPGMTFSLRVGLSSSIWEVQVSRSTNSAAGQVLATLILSTVPVTIAGAPSNLPIPSKAAPTRTLSEVGGLTIAKEYPATNPINVAYDCENGAGCSGRGRWTEGSTPGSQVDAPTDVVLLHELVHAFHLLTSGFSGGPATAELDVLVLENRYRAERRPPVPARAGHGGGCNLGPPSKAESPGSKKGTGKSGCFIATASLEGEYEERLDALRVFRDRIVRSTARGAAFFEEFYEWYARFSPFIAERIRHEPTLKRASLAGLIIPCINYLDMALAFPDDAPPSSLSPEWTKFVERARHDLECWAAFAMPPRSVFPEGVSLADACAEVEFTESHVLRTTISRASYREAVARGEVFVLPFQLEDTFIRDHVSRRESVSSLMAAALAKSPQGRAFRDSALTYFEDFRPLLDLAVGFDPRGKRLLLASFYVPLVNYFDLLLSMPHVAPQLRRDSPWHGFLAKVRDDAKRLEAMVGFSS